MLLPSLLLPLRAYSPRQVRTTQGAGLPELGGIFAANTRGHRSCLTGRVLREPSTGFGLWCWGDRLRAGKERRDQQAGDSASGHCGRGERGASYGLLSSRIVTLQVHSLGQYAVLIVDRRSVLVVGNYIPFLGSQLVSPGVIWVRWPGSGVPDFVSALPHMAGRTFRRAARPARV